MRREDGEECDDSEMSGVCGEVEASEVRGVSVDDEEA